MQGFSGGAEGWKVPCIVHHFTGISDFQDIGSNITAVIVFNVPIVEFQHLKKKRKSMAASQESVPRYF